MNKLVLLVAVALTLGACASYGKQFSQEDIKEFEKGKTTLSEIKNVLGKPYSTGFNEKGEATMTYIYTDIRLKGATFIPIVGIAAGGANTKTQIVKFFFDENEVLLKYDFSESDVETCNYNMGTC